MREIMEKYGEPELIYQRVNEDEPIIYNRELFEKWKKAKIALLELYRDPESECDAGHFVNRIYCDESGNYWLTRFWIDHFGYHWDEVEIYIIHKHERGD